MRAFEKNVRKVDPYVPGEQPKVANIIKLNTNENPYPPTKGVKEALENISVESLKFYPNPTSEILVNKISDVYGMDKEEVFVGVGSDDVLAVAFMTFFNSKKPILFPDVTYSFYDVWAKLFKIPYERPELDDKFRIIKEDYYRENGGVVIANPNAPTGIYENLDFIEDILIHNQDSVVIVDEAYIDFGGKSAKELISKYENLLVVQTFSKSRSMAGMRIGFAMGNKALIKNMNDIKYSYNSYTMNQTSLILGTKVLEDEEYFRATVQKIMDTREYTKKELLKLGFEFLDSKANFLFVKHKNIEGEKLFNALRESNIYVRYFKGERTKDYLRITIGTKEEMDILLNFLREYESK